MLTRTLLLLLSAFFLSRGAEYHIDLKHCGKITTCFAHDVCVKDALNSQELVELPNIDDFKDENCDVIMQIRPFSGSKWHIMVQVNATQYSQPLDDTGISFVQDAVQFACKKSGPTGNMIDFKIEKLGDGKYEERSLFCSFTFETLDASEIESKFTSNENDPKFVVNTLALVFNEPKSKFWQMKVTCNPEMIESSIIPSEEFLQNKVDKYSFPPIKCEPPESLLITRDNASPTLLQEGTELSCKSKFWSYIGQSEIAVPKKEKFGVVCAERFCSRCAPLGNIEIPGGSKPTNGTSGEGCATTTCSDKPWMIDDSRVLNGSMKCEKDEGQAKTSSWYLKTANESIKVTKASCVNTKICLKNVEPPEKCPHSPPMVCKTRTKSADGSEFSCTDDFKLKWEAGGGSPVETASIKCDFTSGKFVDANGNALPSEASVFCTKKGPPIEKPDEVAGKAEKPPSSAGPIVGGVVGGIILLGLVIGLIVMIVMRRRKAAHEAWLKQPLRKVHEADLIFMPILRTPEQDMGYKKDTVEEVEQRVPWDERPRDLPELVPSALCLGKFDNGTFHQIILKEFIQYNAENKKKVFNNIAKMGAYSENKEINLENGNFTQFWQFFDMCVQRNMDSIDVWEMIFRLVRIFHGRLGDKKLFGTHYKTGHTDTFDDRIKLAMIRFAKPVLNCLGWTRRTTDSPTDVWMRFFVVRVLMWTNEASVIVELERQADLPIEELESPMRAIVIGFANSRLGLCRELYRKNWQVAVDNPEDPAKDEYGTIRQHLMFGLCLAEKSKRGIKQMTLVLDYCFDFGAIYTPIDMYWAYWGATEQYDPGLEAIDHFVCTLPKALSFWREDQMRDLCKTKTDSEKAAMKNDWMRASHKTLNILSESTTFAPHYAPGMEKVILATLKYYDTMPPDGNHHDPLLMKERVDNISNRFSDKKKQIEQDFSYALEFAEPKKDTPKKKYLLN